jgi:hypothetical protein
MPIALCRVCMLIIARLLCSGLLGHDTIPLPCTGCCRYVKDSAGLDFGWVARGGSHLHALRTHMPGLSPAWNLMQNRSQCHSA